MTSKGVTLQKEDLLKSVGKNIIRFRLYKGWSQSDLARACDKEPQSIERVENGKINPTIYYLSEIANALEIPLHKLLEM